MSTRRPIRIGNASGAIGDGIDQVFRLATSGVDAITADYLAEFNIAWRAIEQQTRPDLGYEPNFLDQLAWKNGAGAKALAERRVKVVHDGGALNPKGLATKVEEYFKSLGITTVKVAWVEGDNVTPQLKAGTLGGIKHLDYDGFQFKPQKHEILAANIYTGQRGIIAALDAGADVVICGRCCDASPVMGLASWWHGWKASDYDALAGSLMAGHLIECGAYVTGGNFCGADEITDLHHVGYPIAEISADGTSVITKPEGSNGAVTVDTCKAQLLYEIQGRHYLNPDVTAIIDQARLESVGKDRVRLTGIVGKLAPETAKVSICLLGGFQAELCGYAAGPDTDFKFQLWKDQVMGQIDRGQFTTFSIEKYGSVPADPKSQAECTVTFRMFAQSPDKEAFTAFKRSIFYNGMQGYCGLYLNMDWRTMEPKPYVRYIPGLAVQKALPGLTAHVINGRSHDAKRLDPSTVSSQVVPRGPWVTKATGNSACWSGRTATRPLGDLFFARSGDKGGNANLGFWVRSERAYAFAKAFLTESRLIELLGRDWDEERHAVERVEFPNLQAVHFVVRGFLQEGVSSSSVLDGFGKSISEFVRARLVDLPVELVEEEDERRKRNRARGMGAMTKL